MPTTNGYGESNEVQIIEADESLVNFAKKNARKKYEEYVETQKMEAEKADDKKIWYLRILERLKHLVK